MTATQPITDNIVSSDALLAHWQGHRGLTRKTIEAFPEDKLFTYSVGGMRPFAELVSEFLGMTIPGVAGIATGNGLPGQMQKCLRPKQNCWNNGIKLPKN